MYEAGEVAIYVPCTHEKDEYGDCTDVLCDDAYHSREIRKSNAPTVFLNHRCEEWVIGGKEQVEALTKDLAKLLEEHFNE